MCLLQCGLFIYIETHSSRSIEFEIQCLSLITIVELFAYRLFLLEVVRAMARKWRTQCTIFIIPVNRLVVSSEVSYLKLIILIFNSGLLGVLHPHCRVQTVQGPMRQDPSQAAKKRTLLVNDSRTIAERFGKHFCH